MVNCFINVFLGGQPSKPVGLLFWGGGKGTFYWPMEPEYLERVAVKERALQWEHSVSTPEGRAWSLITYLVSSVVSALQHPHLPRCCHLAAKSGPTLCDPMDWGPPGSSVHGISQASTLEWVAISFSMHFLKFYRSKSHSLFCLLSVIFYSA